MGIRNKIGAIDIRNTRPFSWAAYWTGLVSATVEQAAPTKVVMTFGVANTSLVAADFTIAGKTITLLERDVTNKILTLTVSVAVAYGDSLTITFVKTGGTAAVTNNIANIVPVYVSSVIENDTPTILTMNYDLDLADVVPATSAFAVLVNAGSRTVNSVAIVSGNVQLTLASAVIDTDTVTVAYTKPGSNQLQTAAGGQAASLAAQNVTNNVSFLQWTVTKKGTGADAAPIILTVNTEVVLTLSANAKFYSDAGGTADESSTWTVTTGAARTRYIKCTTGTATLTIPSNVITIIGLANIPANAPSYVGSLSKLTALTSFISYYAGWVVDFTNLINLTYFVTQAACTQTGSITNCINLQTLQISGANTISGSITGFTLIATLIVGGTNTITGIIASPELNKCNMTGNTTVSYGTHTWFTNQSYFTVAPAAGYGWSISDISLAIQEASVQSLWQAPKTVTLVGENSSMADTNQGGIWGDFSGEAAPSALAGYLKTLVRTRLVTVSLNGIAIPGGSGDGTGFPAGFGDWWRS